MSTSPGDSNSVTQSPATDGAGDGSRTSLPALIWVSFSIAIGLPLIVAGLRLCQWRISQAVGIALALGVSAWAGLINTTTAPGISDTLLTLIVCGLMGGGFALGLFSFMRIGGIVLLSLLGGIAFGLRIVLLKDDLLIPLFAINWVLVAVMVPPSLALVIWRPRIGTLFGVTSTGTFLIALAVDLLLHTTTSMSVGLRILFDGNSSHIDAIAALSYAPPLTTQITLGVSLALTPILSYLQHKMFPAPSSRNSILSISNWESSAAVAANLDLSLGSRSEYYSSNAEKGALRRGSGPASRFSFS
ncbi:unnamed protein product [Peniophora sp. CBMAI 1063]|nr:unnamed protein product [Peniophora sp. CBMAI 1063]